MSLNCLYSPRTLLVIYLNIVRDSHTLPADDVTQGDIPLGLMQTSLRSRLSRMPHGRHIKDERKELNKESRTRCAARPGLALLGCRMR